jgi:hypothetical protein
MEFGSFRPAVSSAIMLGVVTLALAGCGGDEGGDTAATASAAPGAAPAAAAGGSNRAPTISGAPLSSVMQGTSYSFTPNAVDADGNTLSFAISNKPAWATFSTSTGRLSGTPSAANVGTYANVVISVSDGSSTASLAAFSIQVVATATGSATLMWTPPTQNTDGSPLTNLVGYKIYWGTSQNNLTNSVTLNNAGLSSYVVEQLTPATWYFAVTAVNSTGIESTFSNGASKRVM